MQSFVLQEKWATTLSEKDRKEIEGIFHRSVGLVRTGVIDCTPIWEAKNHRDDLLISVIIHNTTEEPFRLRNTCVDYVIEDGTILVQHRFTTNQLQVEANTSMPWTFIFPGEGNLLEKGKGKLVIANEKSSPIEWR